LFDNPSTYFFIYLLLFRLCIKVVSCVTVPDSDEEHRSPAKGHHPRQQHYNNSNANSYVVREIKPEPASVSSSYNGNNGASLSQKKRLLAKAQTEGGGSMADKPKQEHQMASDGGYMDAYGGADRPSMTHQPCDFSNGSEVLHFQPAPQQVSQQQQHQRTYRQDYDQQQQQQQQQQVQQQQQQQQQRDYLHPPAAHRQQRFDAELQQQREQNGYYSIDTGHFAPLGPIKTDVYGLLGFSSRSNRHAHLSPQPGPSSRHQAAAAVAAAAAAALCLSPQHQLNAAAAAAAGQPLYHQPDLYRR
jgi:hypothetical protein